MAENKKYEINCAAVHNGNPLGKVTIDFKGTRVYDFGRGDGTVYTDNEYDARWFFEHCGTDKTLLDFYVSEWDGEEYVWIREWKDK